VVTLGFAMHLVRLATPLVDGEDRTREKTPAGDTIRQLVDDRRQTPGTDSQYDMCTAALNVRLKFSTEEIGCKRETITYILQRLSEWAGWDKSVMLA